MFFLVTTDLFAQKLDGPHGQRKALSHKAKPIAFHFKATKTGETTK
jgi:hypothetical protein